jgi:GST-like protein
MIEIYTWVTGNCHKVHIALEELELSYEVKPINIFNGEQFAPEFLAINPNNKVPAIVDLDGPGGSPYQLFESGAILLYLAQKTGKLLPSDTAKRFQAIQWLMLQMSGVGPMGGQALHFRQFASEKIPYAIDRYTNEISRLFRVIEARLEQARYLVEDEYTIADIALFPWVRMEQRLGQSFDDLPNIKRWYEEISARPAVQRGLAVLSDRATSPGPLSDEARSALFGDKQYQPRRLFLGLSKA